jgi:hypothetical protein
LIVDFLQPVDWVSLGLDDYPILIKNPMDLGTIKVRRAAISGPTGVARTLKTTFRQAKIESGGYMKHSQVAEDIRLVWQNCKTYNAVWFGSRRTRPTTARGSQTHTRYLDRRTEAICTRSRINSPLSSRRNTQRSGWRVRAALCMKLSQVTDGSDAQPRDFVRCPEPDGTEDENRYVGLLTIGCGCRLSCHLPGCRTLAARPSAAEW